MTAPVILVAVAVSLAQTPQPRNQPACVIEGRVVNSVTGAPVRRANITLRAAERRDYAKTAETDAAGNFRFERVPPGGYTLLGERTGYEGQEFGARSPRVPGTLVECKSGERVSGLVFKLTPQATVRGTVLNDEGEPAGGGTVFLLKQVYTRGRRQLTQKTQANVGGTGEYVLSSISPGRYYLKAGCGAAAETTQSREEAEGEEGCAPAYYPNSLDPAGAAPIELRPGDDVRGIDIRLGRTRLFRIRGTVVRETAEPAPKASVMLAVADPTSLSFTRRLTAIARPRGGSFEIRGVPPGAYVLNAHTPHGDPQKQNAVMLVDVLDRDIDGLAVVFRSLVPVPGRLRFDESPPDKFEGITVALDPEDTFLWGWSQTPVDPDGSFLLKDVQPGRFRVKVNGAPESAFLKSVRYGPQAAAGAVVDLGAGGGGRLEIVLSLAGARLEGSVTDSNGDPLAGAIVTLHPKSQSPDLYRRATADHAGRFHITGIAPGDYSLLAWEEIEEEVEQDPEVIRRFESYTRSVSLGESARETVQLRAAPAEGR